MARANVRFFLNDEVVNETTIETIGETFSESSIDIWTSFFKNNLLTLDALRVRNWDVIEFNVDGVVYTRPFKSEGENNEG